MLPIGWKNVVIKMCEEFQTLKIKPVIGYIGEKNGYMKMEYQFIEENKPYLPQLHDIIDKYELLSEHTCECCGYSDVNKQFERVIDDWIFTLCNKCYQKKLQDNCKIEEFNAAKVLKEYGFKE